MILKMTNAHNSALRVNLNLWIPKQNMYVKMNTIFDTGASKTIIDIGLVELLGIIPKSSNDIPTITTIGKTSLQTCVLPKIMLGIQEINNIPVSITRLPVELETRCILGMNVLREFLITVDSLNRTITLSKQPLPQKFFRDDFSVSLLSDIADSIQYNLAKL